jgi:CRISPR system Cascade subunit CasB
MSELPDFVALKARYGDLGAGPRAELRRVARPDDLALIPAFYRLLPGIQTDARWQRIVFFLPFAAHVEQGDSLGQALAGKVKEERLFQVLRSNPPNDLIQLRRLVQQAEPRVHWQQMGKTLWFWGEISKRRLVEDYFSPASKTEKEANHD